ncbi:MAG TPA: MerR family transcriptional regulator [Euzebyales bacterium]|nr:MerR family transcriptional regulator [Euzebyales bacterium]
MNASRSGPTHQELRLPGLDEGRRGYRGPAVCRVVGITYRQLDYWATTGLVEPSVRDAVGSGSQRLYSFEDIVTLKLVKRLLDVGVSLQRIRRAIDYVRDRGLSLRNLTLASDGETVYAGTDASDVVDLLARGQGVFAIAVDPLYDEMEAEVTALPAEPVVSAPSAEEPPAEASGGGGA